MNVLGQFKTSSKLQMALGLGLLAMVALLTYPKINSIIVLSLAVSLAVLIDLILTKTRQLPAFLLSAAFITGLIIALTFQPEVSWWQILLVVALAIGSKNYIRYKNRHIFNPAAFGLFFGSLLIGTAVSWWGVSWYQGPILLLILIPGLVSLYLMKRHKITLSFLVVYSVIISLLTSSLSLLTILDPTVLFFALVMLPEPMTSPHSFRNQLLFGVTVAVLVGIVSWLSSYLPQFQLDPLIFALLLGNLIFFKLR